MYQIFIRYQNDRFPLWQEHGTYITQNNLTDFLAFRTDDPAVLRDEVLRLDAIHGSDNIKAVEDISLNFDVKIGDEPDAEENPDTGETPGDTGDSGNEPDIGGDGGNEET